MALFAKTPILSFAGKPPVEVSKEPDLLDGWWTSESLYSLERRAVFSKTWMCIAHRSRFTKPGDYISMEIAGFPILIILGKDYVTRAFHNVCRHRAYTITKKPAGSSLMLGCRYHGWSYDTKGSLVKAPQFDGIEGFDKSENGLFKIQTCIDRAGFIRINLDARNNGKGPECDETVGFGSEHGITVSNKWLFGWETMGDFNWRTIGASDRTGIGTEMVPTSKASFMDLILSMFRAPHLDVGGCHILFVHPTTMILTFPDSVVWATMIALPVSATQCMVKCDVYSSDGMVPSEATKEVLKTFITSRIQALEREYEALKVSSTVGGKDSLGVLKAHLKLERLAGREVCPARQEGGNSESFCKAEKLCNELDSLAKAGMRGVHPRVDSMQGGLEW